MRPAPLLAAALAGAALTSVFAPPAMADDPKTAVDIRCVVVGGALAQSEDPNLQNLGRASLFYFLGRLEGRGDTDNLSARIIDAAGQMTADDIKTQSQTCGAMFTSATQTLQSISDAFQQHFGAPTSAAPAH
jgi:hypothetical protein